MCDAKRPGAGIEEAGPVAGIEPRVDERAASGPWRIDTQDFAIVDRILEAGSATMHRQASRRELLRLLDWQSNRASSNGMRGSPLESQARYRLTLVADACADAQLRRSTEVEVRRERAVPPR